MTDTLRLAVCNTDAELVPGGESWNALAGDAAASRADAFLLSEMPFGRWIAGHDIVNDNDREQSILLHDRGMERLGDLGCPVVMGSRPLIEGTATVNAGFVWQGGAWRSAHTKQFFPQEDGFFESSWYSRGATRFGVEQAGAWRIGFLICTDVMFNEWARHYGRSGANLIVVPRATPAGSLERWKTAVRMAAIVSGCYVASSNRTGRDRGGQAFGGGAWIVDPNGDIVAASGPERNVATADLDLGLVAAAQEEYPCYVDDLPCSGG